MHLKLFFIWCTGLTYVSFACSRRTSSETSREDTGTKKCVSENPVMCNISSKMGWANLVGVFMYLEREMFLWNIIV